MTRYLISFDDGAKLSLAYRDTGPAAVSAAIAARLIAAA